MTAFSNALFGGTGFIATMSCLAAILMIRTVLEAIEDSPKPLRVRADGFRSRTPVGELAGGAGDNPCRDGRTSGRGGALIAWHAHAIGAALTIVSDGGAMPRDRPPDKGGN